MAQEFEYTCRLCGYSLLAWDDGNPYAEHPPGMRMHFYHPSDIEEQMRAWLQTVIYDPEKMTYEEMFRQHTGNEFEHVCRRCCHEALYDPDKDVMVCQECGGGPLVMVLSLAGQKCLKCDGTFEQRETNSIS